MKALACILAITSLSLIAGAQEFKPTLEKTTDKYGLKLKKDSPGISSLKSQTNLSLKLKEFQLRERLGTKFRDHQVTPRTQANGWYVIPHQRSISRIPNALPYLLIPDVAAIPNPLLRNKKRVFDSSPLN